MNFARIWPAVRTAGLQAEIDRLRAALAAAEADCQRRRLHGGSGPPMPRDEP